MPEGFFCDDCGAWFGEEALINGSERVSEWRYGEWYIFADGGKPIADYLEVEDSETDDTFESYFRCSDCDAEYESLECLAVPYSDHIRALREENGHYSLEEDDDEESETPDGWRWIAWDEIREGMVYTHADPSDFDGHAEILTWIALDDGRGREKIDCRNEQYGNETYTVKVSRLLVREDSIGRETVVALFDEVRTADNGTTVEFTEV